MVQLSLLVRKENLRDIMKKIFPLIAFLLFVPLKSAAETVKFVSSLPLTGSGNAVASSMSNGIRMAIEDAGGKAGPFDIEYESLDDASPERGTWDPNIEAANAERAIRDPDVIVYIGPYNSGAAKISMPKLNEAGLAMISPGNSWAGLTKPGTGEANEPAVYRPSGRITYFRVVPADDIQGSVSARWAHAEGLNKVFLVHDRELYGKGIGTIFEKTARSIGMQIVGFEGIDTKAPNYRSLAIKIRQAAPDLVYLAGTTQSNMGQVAKDIRHSGSKVKILAPDGCFDSAFIEAAGASNLEGTTFATFGGVPPDQLKGKGARFYEEYKKRFGRDPESYGVYGYDAANAAIEAIKTAGRKDRAAVLDALRNTKDFDGALGIWSFDPNGDTTLSTMSINVVEGGSFRFVKKL